MANALERASEAAPEATAPAAPGATDVAQLLEGIRQDASNELMRVFDEASRITGATMGEVMWAIAMVQARILASAQLGDEAEWVARRFHELVQCALPAMMMAVEKARREGKPPNDA